jgi:hypothetical protein
LGHPRPGRARRHAQDVDAAGGKLDHEQHIQTPEQDRVDVEEVARQDPLGLDGQDLSPGQPARRGAGSMPARLRSSHTVLDASLKPSRASSPWLRRYPRSGSRLPAAGSGAATPVGSTVDRAGGGVGSSGA